MLIQIDRLKRRPRQIEVDEPAINFVVLHELINQGSVAFTRPVQGLLTATWAGEVVEVKGRLTTTVDLSCARCLKPVTRSLDIEVVLCYTASDDEEKQLEEEIELISEEVGLIRFSGPEIDLQPDIEQEVVMALPQHLLCNQACQGLCPVCGINLNQGQCDCEKPIFHSGLAALKNFKV